MTDILTDVPRMIRSNRRDKRPREPIIFAQVEDTTSNGKVWALYVCIHREGEFRRIELDLDVAQAFLATQATAVAKGKAGT